MDTRPHHTSDAGRLASSFLDFLQVERPDLVPTFTPAAPHAEATTILALRYADGVVMAGDRRATEGFSIAHRAIEKVFPADSHSAVAIAGAAGPSIEMVRLFQVELEYYEKVEGESLSLAGKANHLGRLIRANLPAAMQGLVVLPLFAGFDVRRAEGRIYRYDVTGGTYTETEFHAAGSGGQHARNTMKKVYTRAEEVDRAGGLRLAFEALADAAEEDAGTAGLDPVAGIYPTAFAITEAGVQEVDAGEVETLARALLDERSERARRNR